MDNIPVDFDGFYFLPGDHDEEMSFAYFKLAEEFACDKMIESSDNGMKYHIAFFRKNEEGLPEFDEEFEAILGDPTTYITNLIGHNLYGCVLKKTEKSSEWWKDYLTNAKKNIRMLETTSGE